MCAFQAIHINFDFLCQESKRIWTKNPVIISLAFDDSNDLAVIRIRVQRALFGSFEFHSMIWPTVCWLNFHFVRNERLKHLNETQIKTHQNRFCSYESQAQIDFILFDYFRYCEIKRTKSTTANTLRYCKYSTLEAYIFQIRYKKEVPLETNVDSLNHSNCIREKSGLTVKRMHKC